MGHARISGDLGWRQKGQSPADCGIPDKNRQEAYNH